MNTAMELGPTAGLALLVTVAAARTSHVTAGGAGPHAATTGGYAWALGTAGLAFALLAVLTLTALPLNRPGSYGPPAPA